MRSSPGFLWRRRSDAGATASTRSSSAVRVIFRGRSRSTLMWRPRPVTAVETFHPTFLYESLEPRAHAVPGVGRSHGQAAPRCAARGLRRRVSGRPTVARDDSRRSGNRGRWVRINIWMSIIGIAMPAVGSSCRVVVEDDSTDDIVGAADSADDVAVELIGQGSADLACGHDRTRRPAALDERDHWYGIRPCSDASTTRIPPTPTSVWSVSRTRPATGRHNVTSISDPVGPQCPAIGRRVHNHFGIDPWRWPGSVTWVTCR